MLYYICECERFVNSRDYIFWIDLVIVIRNVNVKCKMWAVLVDTWTVKIRSLSFAGLSSRNVRFREVSSRSDYILRL